MTVGEGVEKSPFADEILKMNGGTQKFGTPPWEKA
jgi:hypothetical protein